MARNFYFSEKVRSEMDLYEDLVIEALKIYGQDVYYLPRHLVNEDTLFGDDPTSRFPQTHKIEMYIENVEGFDGEGDLFTRFGVEIRDEVTLVVSRSRWSRQVRRLASSGITNDRPTEGDLIYLPLTNKIFEVRHVEHEQPFYQIENLPVYKLRCTLFEYTGEDMDTAIDEIQEIERDGTYQYKVCVAAPKDAQAVALLDSNYAAHGYVVPGYALSDQLRRITITAAGTYYTQAPTITFIGGADSTGVLNVPIGDSAAATASITNGAVTSIDITDSGNSYVVAPTVVITGGNDDIDSAYNIGDTVSQTFSSGVTISGEIQSIILESNGMAIGDSSRCYLLAHVGADDGKYHTFINTGTVPPYNASTGALMNTTTGATTGLQINSVVEVNKISETEQNETFSDFSDDFLDFSEDNPFGDPENQ